MILITGTIKVATEAEADQALDALTGRAHRSRQHEGNIEYVFSQNIEDPTEIRLLEKWSSEAALNAHLTIPDDEFDTIMRTATIETATVVCYDVANERVLMQR